MKYSFLHVSDLHYRPEWPEQVGLVCDKFIEHLVSHAAAHENLYLVFSGDLVNAGAEEPFYRSFRDKFEKAFGNAGIPRERRICVPGNHDVSQTALKPFLQMQKGTLATIQSEELFNDTLPSLTSSFFNAKFANYTECESNFSALRCCSTGLGGSGWELPDNVGLYCLNTALCSFAGSKDLDGNKISDEKRLMIDTRSLYRWLSETPSSTRILVMHHPTTWLAEWAQTELEKIIAANFHLVFSGHLHKTSALYSSPGFGGSVYCVAPPLFTRKDGILGYAFVTLDTASHATSVEYHQWAPSYKFVKGTALSGNDDGLITFGPSQLSAPVFEVVPPASSKSGTLAVLQAEFDEAATGYSSKKQVWVERDLANLPETAPNRDEAILITPSAVAKHFRSHVIRAPKEYGLTCLGRFIALEHYKQNGGVNIIAMLDTKEVVAEKAGIAVHIKLRCSELETEQKKLSGFILDNFGADKAANRILKELSQLHPGVPILILRNVEDCSHIALSVESEELNGYTTLYLWALTRTRVRELCVAYIAGMDSLDDSQVTKKVIEDVDALNIHRTPLNCLLLLKVAVQSFDESPVNRTEMIERVLSLLFFQFDQIPRYATRPDLKDCEYALGYFSEWMIKNGRTAFSQMQFHEKIGEYCKTQILDLDIGVLFAFLATENIFIRKGAVFEFRSAYWLYFFTAHRMHHDLAFADFILSNRRYAAYPEVIEFYAGIDRRRSDAIIRLTEDLRAMNSGFLERTGIDEGFNPFKHARWEPDEVALKRLAEDVNASVAESSLPAVVKDAFADRDYDRAKPYKQELAKFIEASTLNQLMQGMKGAARALRNSDYVLPADKAKLLEEVLCCWVRICQILAFLSPILARQRSATCEDICFILTKDFDDQDEKKRWGMIMDAVIENVVSWFHEDLFSKKMGPLLSNYIESHQGEFGELLTLLVMIRQRPSGWTKEVERYISRESKNSFYLSSIFFSLRREARIGFVSEKAKQELRRLSAMSLAKHHSGAKHLSAGVIRRAAEALDKDDKLRAQREEKASNQEPSSTGDLGSEIPE